MALREDQGENPGFFAWPLHAQLGRANHAEQMVYEFPVLTFVGTLNTDMDPDRLYSFDVRDGETTWRELSIERPDDQMGPPDLVKNAPDR